MSGWVVEIPGILVQPESSSAHERRDEIQQPGSPSVFISNPRAVDPSRTTGVIGGKAPVTEDSRVELSSSSSEEESDFEDELTTVANPLFLIRVSSPTSRRKKCMGASR